MSSAWTSLPVTRDLQNHSAWVFGELEDYMHVRCLGSLWCLFF